MNRARGKAVKYSTMFSEVLADCGPEVTAYGKCVQSNLDDLRKDVCATEFTALKKCAEVAFRKARAKAAR